MSVIIHALEAPVSSRGGNRDCSTLAGVRRMVSPKPYRSRNQEFRDKIAREMQQIVHDAAGDATGMSVKAQIKTAWEQLDKPAYWRVRKAWFGYGGNWMGEAIDDFRQRKRRWEQRQLESARGEAADHMAHLSRLRAALAHVDEDFHRPEIDALQWAIERYRVRDVAGRGDE